MVILFLDRCSCGGARTSPRKDRAICSVHPTRRCPGQRSISGRGSKRSHRRLPDARQCRSLGAHRPSGCARFPNAPMTDLARFWPKLALQGGERMPGTSVVAGLDLGAAGPSPETGNPPPDAAALHSQLTPIAAAERRRRAEVGVGLAAMPGLSAWGSWLIMPAISGPRRR